MHQVSMSSVNLNDTKARFAGTTCAGGKSRNDVFNTLDRERLGHRIVIRERQCTRSNDVPTPLTFGDRSVACPRPAGTALPTGMHPLHPSHAALLVNIPHVSR